MLLNNKINGVALYVKGNCIFLSKGYTLYKFYPETGKQEFFAKLNDNKNALKARFKLTRRLFRAEIRHLYHFQNDTWMCIAKKAIFRYNATSGLLEKCCDIEKGSRPMCLCQANDGTIYYGEYCYNPDKKPMRIIQSKDNGNTWNVAYTFGQGEINHIHSLFQDPYSEKVWVATGDDDEACMFGYTEDGFKTFVRKFEGKQQYRLCAPLFTEKEIIFATDSQYAQNVICSIDRETGEIKDLCEIQGSGIYAAQNGNLMMVSTTVEPSTVNLDRSSHLWYSFDGRNWKELISFKKDCLKDTYFQFGSIRFPNYEGDCPWLAFNGRALEKIDQKTGWFDIASLTANL